MLDTLSRDTEIEGLGGVILPVLRGMPEVPVRAPLLRAFAAGSAEFAAIEAGFRNLTAEVQDAETLCRFFASWGQTNNSAMTVSGIGNRLTLCLHRGEAMRDPLALTQVLAALHRITDEDLAVTHKILHSELFYSMATGIAGDDSWLQHRHVDPAAAAFKAWKDHMSLREDDIALGLLTTLVHEIYTHGEVEFILPLFRRWLTGSYRFSETETARVLRWITVHCGGTEKNHFFHALDALDHYARAAGIDWADYDLEGIVGRYLRRKAAVLDALFPAGHA